MDYSNNINNDNNTNNINNNAQVINNMNQMVNICNSMNYGDNSFAQFGMVMGAGIEGGVDSMPMQMATMLGGISMMNNPQGNSAPMTNPQMVNSQMVSPQMTNPQMGYPMNMNGIDNSVNGGVN